MSLINKQAPNKMYSRLTDFFEKIPMPAILDNRFKSLFYTLTQKEQVLITSIASAKELNGLILDKLAKSIGIENPALVLANDVVRLLIMQIFPDYIDELSKELTLQETTFINYYFETFNPRYAAIKASYANPLQGEYLLTKPHIQREIDKRQALLESSTGISASKVVLEYAKIGFSNMFDLISVKNNVVSLKDSAGIDGTAISELKQDKDGNITLKLHNKIVALDKLTKILSIKTKDTYAIVNADKEEKADPLGTLLNTLESMVEKQEDSALILEDVSASMKAASAESKLIAHNSGEVIDAESKS